MPRIVAEKLSARWNQPVIVENRPGAGGNIGAEAMSRSPADGYTLMSSPVGPVAANAYLFRKLSYDPTRFVPISLLGTTISVLAVRNTLPARTVQELAELARSQPGKVTYAIAGPASGHRLFGELLQIEGKVDMVGVTFKGASQAMIDLLGGRIDAMVETATFSLAQVKGGKMRAIAVSTAGRYAPLPDVPSVNASLPGVEYSSWLGLTTSSGTPRPIIDRLNREIRGMLQTAEVQQQLAQFGGDATPSTPEQMRDRVVSEIARWKRVAEIRNIQSN